MPWICRVAIDQIVQKIDKDYDYLLPDHFAASVMPGMRVLVPFGNGNVLKKAMVFSVFEGTPAPKLKAIVRVLDQKPMLDENHLRLAEWMADQYFVTRYQAVRCMIPRGLDYKINEIFALNPDRQEFPEEYAELVKVINPYFFCIILICLSSCEEKHICFNTLSIENTCRKSKDCM